MSRSNLPPGVTGGEYEIAGPDYEAEEFHACCAKTVDWHVLTSVQLRSLEALVAGVRSLAFPPPGETPPVPVRLYGLAAALEQVEKVSFDECPFAGEVMVFGYRGRRWWRCPACGADYENDDDE
jgi:hypothetical protein